MKKLMTFALAAAILFGLTLTQVTYAQDNGGAEKGNQEKVKPNYVDEDGDGICDNHSGNGTGTEVGKGKGHGHGADDGTGHGAGMHKRLRDGSCHGDATSAAPSGTTNTNKGRGKCSNAAPAK